MDDERTEKAYYGLYASATLRATVNEKCRNCHRSKGVKYGKVSNGKGNG